MQEVITFLTSYGWLKSWMLIAFLIVFATAAAQYFIKRFLNKLLPTLENTHNIWDDCLVRAMMRPVSYLIWAIGLTMASELISSKLKNDWFAGHLPDVRSLAIIGTLVWFLIRFIAELQDALLDPKRGYQNLEKSTVLIVCQMLRLAVIVTAILITLQTFDVKISGLVAAGGISTIMISLAAKDWLSNFFGGLMVYLDRPFSVGDWIRSPDKSIEGTVEYIGWRTTRIRTFDKRPLYVPNGVFSTISVENPSRMSNRRIRTLVGLRYDDADKVAVVLKDIKQMLHDHPEIDNNQICLVNLVEFGPYALNFMVYTFTKTTHWATYMDIQQDVFLKILEIIDRHGAKCAFPTTTLDMPGEMSSFEHLPDANQGVNHDNYSRITGETTSG